jgi:hypothetical protein
MSSIAFTLSWPAHTVEKGVPSDSDDTLASDPPTVRSIWLRSTSPYLSSSTGAILLEQAYDSYPLGGVPSTRDFSFVIALGYKNPDISENKERITTSSTISAALFAADVIRWDETTGEPFLWSGSGANIVGGQAHSVEFAPESQVTAALTEGDYIFLNIQVETSPSEVPKPGLLRASALRLGSALRSSGSSSSSSGLGAGPDVVPKEPAANQNSGLREVKIGYHPIMGGVGKFLDDLSGGMPMYMQHWAVIVGDYYHELNADKDGKNVYQNGKVADAKFRMTDAGYTTWNDRAIADAGPIAIGKMDAYYRLKDNNCQKFSINLLDIICQVGRRKFHTSYDPAAAEAGPEFDPETGMFKPRPVVPKVEEKPKPVTEGVQLYYEPYLISGTTITDDVVELGDQEKKEVLDRAKDITEGRLSYFY